MLITERWKNWYETPQETDLLAPRSRLYVLYQLLGQSITPGFEFWTLLIELRQAIAVVGN